MMSHLKKEWESLKWYNKWVHVLGVINLLLVLILSLKLEYLGDGKK